MHHLPDDPKFTEVAPRAFSAKWLLEGSMQAMFSQFQMGPEDPVDKPQHHEVLDHLLAQVVVDAVDLVLTKQGGCMVKLLVGNLQVPPKELLHDDTVLSGSRRYHGYSW